MKGFRGIHGPSGVVVPENEGFNFHDSYISSSQALNVLKIGRGMDQDIKKRFI